MKNIYKNSSFFLILLISNLAMATPDPDDIDGDTDPTDVSGTPIDANLWLLIVLGIAFCWWFFRKYSQKNA